MVDSGRSSTLESLAKRLHQGGAAVWHQLDRDGSSRIPSRPVPRRQRRDHPTIDAAQVGHPVAARRRGLQTQRVTEQLAHQVGLTPDLKDRDPAGATGRGQADRHVGASHAPPSACIGRPLGKLITSDTAAARPAMNPV